jgi:hypothetical protein
MILEGFTFAVEAGISQHVWSIEEIASLANPTLASMVA